MKNKHKIIGLGYFILVLLSCTSDPSINTDVLSKPTAVTSDIPPVNTSVTATPSSLTSTPTPVVSAILSSYYEDLSKENKYHYYSNVYCEFPDGNKDSFKLEPNASISVTKDGKAIYILNPAKDSSKDNKTFIEIPYIYKLTEDKKLSIIKNNEDSLSKCQQPLGIALDKDDNIYTYYPLYDDLKINEPGSQNYGHMVPFKKGYEVIKIFNEKDVYLIGDIKYPVPEIVSAFSELSRSYDIYNLYISKRDNSIYFGISYSYLENKSCSINKLEILPETGVLSQKKLIDSCSDTSFIVENNKIYFSTLFVDLTEPEKKYHAFITTQPNNIFPTQIKMNSKGEIIATFNASYEGSTNEKNKIMKIVSGKGVFNLAGSGNAGFKDGKGTEAEFNNPTGLDIDAQDNIYVADTGNNAIRKITPDGEVTTFYKEGN